MNNNFSDLTISISSADIEEVRRFRDMCNERISKHEALFENAETFSLNLIKNRRCAILVDEQGNMSDLRYLATISDDREIVFASPVLIGKGERIIISDIEGNVYRDFGGNSKVVIPKIK